MPERDSRDIKITPVKPSTTAKQEATFYAPNADFNNKGLVQPSPDDFYFGEDGQLYVRPNDFYNSVTDVKIDWDRYVIVVDYGNGQVREQPIPHYVNTPVVSTKLVTVVEFDDTVNVSPSVNVEYKEDNSIIILSSAWKVDRDRAYLVIPANKMFQNDNNYIAQTEQRIRTQDDYDDTPDLGGTIYGKNAQFTNVMTGCIKTNDGSYVIYSSAPFEGRVIFIGGYMYVNNNLLQLLYKDSDEEHVHVLTYWKASVDKDNGEKNGVTVRDVPIVTPVEAYTLFGEDRPTGVGYDDRGLTFEYSDVLAINSREQGDGSHQTVGSKPKIKLRIVEKPDEDNIETTIRDGVIAFHLRDSFVKRVSDLEDYNNKTLPDTYVKQVKGGDNEFVYGRLNDKETTFKVREFTDVYGPEDQWYNTIARRTSTGTLRAESPTNDYDLVTLTYFKTNVDNKLGIPGGIATLDTTGKVPAVQLPSYVDDVLEFANTNNFPEKGEPNKIYVATDTNLTYRWSGSEYVEISKSLALGETSSTAYAGDKGKENSDNIIKLQQTLGEVTSHAIIQDDKIEVLETNYTGINTRLKTVEGSYVHLTTTANQLYGTDNVGHATTYNLVDFVRSSKVDVLDNPDASDNISVLWPSADGTLATEAFVQQKIREAGTIASDDIVLVNKDQDIDCVKTFLKTQKFEEGGATFGNNTVITLDEQTKLVKTPTAVGPSIARCEPISFADFDDGLGNMVKFGKFTFCNVGGGDILTRPDLFKVVRIKGTLSKGTVSKLYLYNDNRLADKLLFLLNFKMYPSVGDSCCISVVQYMDSDSANRNKNYPIMFTIDGDTYIGLLKLIFNFDSSNVTLNIDIQNMFPSTPPSISYDVTGIVVYLDDFHM